MEMLDPVTSFIEAASAPLDSSHASGSLDEADGIRGAHRDVTNTDIYAASVFGDPRSARTLIDANPLLATTPGGPRQWDALTYLCFSRYLRLDRTRTDDFMSAATTLLDAGAPANTGWFETRHQPRPVFESAIYGAAGVAQSAALTRLLLERGADPNDEETPYHVAESYDNDALEVLVESGRLNEDSLATILLRKSDWHDCDAIRWLLERGVDSNRITRWGRTALHNAVMRDNHISVFEMLLDHGADPTIPTNSAHGFHEPPSRSAIQLAARYGRDDALELFKKRGVDVTLDGVESLMAACATNDTAAIDAIIASEPTLVEKMRTEGGSLLARFAGTGNSDGINNLLRLGIPTDKRFVEGDGYYDIAPHSTALHIASWRGRSSIVTLLVENGAHVNAVDGKGRTPLELAVKACTDSYWMDRRTPESVACLLDAGADASAIPVPTGYDSIDGMLSSRR